MVIFYAILATLVAIAFIVLYAATSKNEVTDGGTRTWNVHEDNLSFTQATGPLAGFTCYTFPAMSTYTTSVMTSTVLVDFGAQAENVVAMAASTLQPTADDQNNTTWLTRFNLAPELWFPLTDKTSRAHIDLSNSATSYSYFRVDVDTMYETLTITNWFNSGVPKDDFAICYSVTTN